VYVSHRLGEVLRIADRVTVLRDGRSVAEGEARAFDERALVAAMVGRTVEALFPAAGRPAGTARLAVRGLSVEDPSVRGRRLLDDVTFEVKAGEVLGIAGLMGAGRTTLLATLFGAAPGRVHGTVEVDGVQATIASPRDAIARGLALLTEDRKRLGLLLGESISVNVTLASLASVSRAGMLVPGAEQNAGTSAVTDLGIRAASPDVAAGTLSGGNQQKVVIARWLRTHPRVLLLDEPTRGVDVGAREEIYATIDRLARAGMAVVVVSSDLTEVLGLADRVVVLRQGRVAGRFARADATPEAVMASATGTG
jgi:D-xylose transport system ATP-binding protein